MGAGVNTGMNKGVVIAWSVVQMTVNGSNAFVLAVVAMTPPKTQKF